MQIICFSKNKTEPAPEYYNSFKFLFHIQTLTVKTTKLIFQN
jgi:hypothetical protein